MTLASAWILHFLWMLPLSAFLLVVQYRRRRQAMERFAEPELLERITVSVHAGKRVVIVTLFLAAMGLMVFALAGPRWGSRYQEVSRKGVDIMVMVDVSRSMMVADVKPNRLERARREILDFLKVVAGDRVGLTTFAGAAFVQCPLTLDYAAVEMFLNVLEPGIIPVPGTDLGAAIETALAAFDFESATDKVMLLITDGEDNEKRGMAAAREAARRGVRIFVFGIGEPSGGPVPAGEGKGGFAQDGDGRLVLSRLDEKNLQALASATGGAYAQSTAGDMDLDLLYFDGIRRKTEAQELKSGKIKIYEERFHLFILAAFLLLLLEGFLDDKRRPPTGKKAGRLLLLTGCCLGLLLPATGLRAAESPDELYRQGQFEEAKAAYSKGDMENPKDIRYRYNRGCAAFQSGQYEEAEAAFSSVLRRTADRQIQYKAAYNLGNTAFKQKDYSAAAAFYRQALVRHPDSEDARHNLELALRAMEQMKRQQDQPKQGEKENNPSGEQSPGNEKEKGGSKSPSYDAELEKETNRGDRSEEQKDNDAENARDGNRKPEKADPDEEAGEGRRAESDSEKDLSGELQPMEPMAAMKKQEAKEAPAGTDRKSAEALLDNVQENPAAIMRYMVPQRKGDGSPSGRDW